MDVNGDALPDLVDEVATGGCGAGYKYEGAFDLGYTWQREFGSGQEDRQFEKCYPSASFGLGGGGRSILDIDGDGLVDVLASVGSGAWVVYFGLGDGSFTSQGIPFAVPSGFTNHQTSANDTVRTFRDMDRDGVPEWVTANSENDKYWVYRQTQAGEAAKPGYLLERVDTELGGVFEYTYAAPSDFAGLEAFSVGRSPYVPETLPTHVVDYGGPLWLLASENIW